MRKSALPLSEARARWSCAAVLPSLFAALKLRARFGTAPSGADSSFE